MRAAQFRVRAIGDQPPAGTDERVYALRPWMHDFSELGVNTDFRAHKSLGERAVNVVRRMAGKGELSTEGSHANQAVRDREIKPRLARAFQIARVRFGAAGSFLDTFSADGYYGMWVAKNVGVRVTCVELEIEQVRRARLMAQILGLNDVQVLHQDVHDMDDSTYDVALCMGGLYHVADPEAVVAKLAHKANVLVTQSAVSVAETDPDYFVTPRPGWQHGSIFSTSYYERMVTRSGWTIVDAATAVPPYNDLETPQGVRRNDWQLATFLCVRDP
jgi:hypothetical protein